ncbi:MAG TPA: hypothetical protein VFP65_17310 [Anaeromyxobacteraceae bacterium]|nr:hypothetical protein [Anaeromyxobacteraceae bacterium]
MLRTPRPAIAAAVLLAGACASVGASRREGRLKDGLDGYAIDKPLEEVWPEAMKVALERGYEPVGKDRAVLGLPPQGTWGNLLAKGHETQRLGSDGLVLETNQDAEKRRYRIEGRRAGTGSRVRFVVVQQRSEDPSEELSRDLDAELELVRRFDPAGAARLIENAERS